MATGYAHYKFRRTLTRLPVRQSTDSQRELLRLVSPFLKFIAGEGRAIFTYLLCISIGALSWLNNIRQTIDAVPFYHHEVFDSLSHPYGFLAYKICLFVSWVIVYPIAGFLLVSMSISTYVVLQRAWKAKIIRPHVTHPDNCYGFRDVGSLNIALLSPYLLTYALMFTIIATLGLYESILLPLVGLTVVFLAMSYIVLMPAYKLLQEVKDTTFQELLRQSETIRAKNTDNTIEFTVARLCFVTATASPYSEKAKIVLVAFRSIPIITVAIKILERFHVLT
ncbi:MAG: hypothetical protein P4L87_07360 [Formivibrio sp.]|nr:hypothetical protein [Formivibrio sp.]